MQLLKLYEELLSKYGPQHWWPARTRFEVIVGAVLTQNTAWSNVEKAIRNLRKARMLSITGIQEARLPALEAVIRPAGFYRQKAKRLKIVADHFGSYPSLNAFFNRPLNEVRAELLSINGIGPETADSILLYAGDKPVFVIDAYTKRLCVQKGLTKETDYECLRAFF